MILVFGTICLDRVRTVPQLPAPGGYVEVEKELILLGGEAANTANALNAWGAEIRLAGNRLGSGPDARRLHRTLVEKGLPTDLLCGESLETDVAPICDIYVTPNGERTMFGLGFARMNASLDLSAVPFVPGHWFTADPNMGERAREAARRAHEQGMRTYLMDFLRETDPVEEGSILQTSTDWAGHRSNTQKNVVWVRQAVERTGAMVVLSDGPNGFVVGSRELPAQAFPPFPAPEVVDSTGAGDMFRAGMLLMLDRGRPLPDCLRFAAAAACLKCRALGATTFVPTEAEVLAHIAEHPQVSRAYG